MNKNLFPALFILIFMGISVVMAFLYMPTAISKTENPTLKSIMVGTWAPTFEKSLNESFPIFNSIRNFWGRLEYDVFNEGRKGVLIGKNGWLFTDEEFECIRHGDQNMMTNLDFIKATAEELQNKNVKLVVALIPSKARLYKDYLGDYKVPVCRTDLYAKTISYLQDNSITGISLLDVFSETPEKDTLFLKTDTHWTPEGANLAATTIAKNINSAEFTSKEFQSNTEKAKPHEGDLLRYLPGVKNDVIKEDTMNVFVTQESSSGNSVDTALDLFGDTVVPITLVGTSYSANPSWNFYGFLKDALDVDILDMSDEGQGPFAVMKAYIESETWRNTPPSLVIWEIPERYMTMVPPS